MSKIFGEVFFMVLDAAVLTALRKKYLTEMFTEAQRLADIFRDKGAQKVCLFGSLTNDGVHLRVTERGAILDSDIDMAVVVGTAQARESCRALQFLTDEVVPRFPLDLLVFSPEEMEERLNHDLLKGSIEIRYGEEIKLKDTDRSIVIDRSSPRPPGRCQ